MVKAVLMCLPIMSSALSDMESAFWQRASVWSALSCPCHAQFLNKAAAEQQQVQLLALKTDLN